MNKQAFIHDREKWSNVRVFVKEKLPTFLMRIKIEEDANTGVLHLDKKEGQAIFYGMQIIEEEMRDELNRNDQRIPGLVFCY